MNNTRWTLAEKQLLLNLREQGLSYRKIARELNYQIHGDYVLYQFPRTSTACRIEHSRLKTGKRKASDGSN